jgi:hypothetical protein
MPNKTPLTDAAWFQTADLQKRYDLSLKLERDLATARKELEAAREDSERLGTIEALFERYWGGTLGTPSCWRLIGPYRHTLQKMNGETFREAIDSVRRQG